MHAYSPQDLPHSVAPGYYLAQGRLAGMLPLVALTLASPAGWDSWAARRRNADSAMAARHGHAAERYAELLGCSRGVVMKACQLLSLASLPSAGPPEHQAVYQSVLDRRAGDTPSMPAGLAADLCESDLLASLLRLSCGMTCVQADVPALARELSARITEEIDYRVEAANQ